MLGLTTAMPSRALSGLKARQSAAARRIVCTARQQHQPSVHKPSVDNSGTLAAAALRTLETAALVVAAGTHWGAAARAQQEAANAALVPAADRGKRSRLDHVSAAPPTPALLAPVLDAPVPDWLPTGGLWLTLPLLIAFVAGRLPALLRPRRTAALRMAEGAAARLLHAEAQLRQQGEALALLSRQVDKATTRSRLSSRDLRLPIKQLEAAGAEQTALLAALVQRMDATERGVREVEALVAALQALAAKQFNVLATVVARQTAFSSSTSSSALQPAPPLLQEEQHALQEKQQAAAVPQPKRQDAHRAWVPPAASGKPVLAAASQQHQQEVASGSPSVDEWGRRILVKHVPTAAAPSSPTAQPAPLAAAPPPNASVPPVALSAADLAEDVTADASSSSEAAEHVQSAFVQRNADGSQTYRF